MRRRSRLTTIWVLFRDDLAEPLVGLLSIVAIIAALLVLSGLLEVNP